MHVRNPGLEISLQCDECVATLPTATSIQVFRIIQECLTNIVRHANANKVDINLNIKGQQLFLSIKDNGQGCDFQQVKTGFGLRGMKERVNSLGGTMQLESPEGKGVLVTVIILVS